MLSCDGRPTAARFQRLFAAYCAVNAIVARLSPACLSDACNLRDPLSYSIPGCQLYFFHLFRDEISYLQRGAPPPAQNLCTAVLPVDRADTSDSRQEAFRHDCVAANSEHNPRVTTGR